MIVTRTAVLTTLLLACAAQADAARYLRLLNRSHDSVMTVEVAVAGSDTFEARRIDPISGGGGSAMVHLGDAGCRFDVRLQFRNGRQAVYREVDVCKGDALVIAPLPSAAVR